MQAGTQRTIGFAGMQSLEIRKGNDILDTIQTNWNLNYTIEYPDVKPIAKPKEADKYSRTWGNIIWSFLESGREIVKVIPPKEITPESASIGLSKHLLNHDYQYPVRYFKRDGALYLYRVF